MLCFRELETLNKTLALLYIVSTGKSILGSSNTEKDKKKWQSQWRMTWDF